MGVHFLEGQMETKFYIRLYFINNKSYRGNHAKSFFLYYWSNACIIALQTIGVILALMIYLTLRFVSVNFRYFIKILLPALGFCFT